MRIYQSLLAPPTRFGLEVLAFRLELAVLAPTVLLVGLNIKGLILLALPAGLLHILLQRLADIDPQHLAVTLEHARYRRYYPASS